MRATEPSNRAIRIIDTSFVTGLQELWEGRLSRIELLAALAALDSAEFEAIEIASLRSRTPRSSDAALDWAAAVGAITPGTRLRWVGRIGVGGIDPERARAVGISSVRLGNLTNDAAEAERVASVCRAAGLEFVADVVLQSTPIGGDPKGIALLVEEFVDAGARKMCLTDSSGVLTTDQVRDYVSTLVGSFPDVDWEFHTRCSNWLGPMNAVAAIEEGVGAVHTAVHPLASAESTPNVQILVDNLRAQGRSVRCNTADLAAVSEFLEFRALRNGLPIPEPRQYDTARERHHLPEPIVTRLRLQLRDTSTAIQDVLAEVEAIWIDLGCPVMAEPLRSAIIAQALVHVGTAAKRFEVVPAEMRAYGDGRSGNDAARSAMTATMKRKLRRAEILDVRHYGIAAGWLLQTPLGAEMVEPSVSRDEPVSATSSGHSIAPLVWLVRELCAGPAAGTTSMSSPEFRLAMTRTNRIHP